ncbi:hypothetical protein TNCT_569761 [Trichonephila clavata]|uniref:Uncharacterized protein n=1 Tax=Trichonephila clavata TaxID=2740835 RepID=A0A8X6L222_TRICU|nr:hypothetical protein TNCT_569761 [Trichonephila clavata]
MFQACSQAFTECRKILSPKTNCSDEVCEIYVNIITWVEMVEKSLGLPLFLLATLGFMHAFSSLAFYMGFEHSTVCIKPPFSYAVILYSPIHFLNWILLLIMAAEVNEQDKSFRKIATREFLQPQNSNENQRLDYIMRLKPTIAISSCGIFNFTRPLILTAVGALFTYTLLLM